MGLPIRFIKLSYFFIKNKGSFLDGLEILYYRMFYQLKDKKIEVYNRKILLNCYTIRNLLTTINARKFKEGDLNFFLKEMRNAIIKFNKYESDNRDLTKFNYGILKNSKDINLIIPHYYHKEGFNTIHATSNVPLKLHKDQRVDLPMPDLIKKGSKNPGTIITREVDQIIDIKKHKLVCTHQLNSIIYNHLDIFKMNVEDMEYIYNKNYTFEYIMQVHLNRVDHNLTKQFRNNLYNFAFINSTDDDFINEIKSFINDDVP